MLTESTRSSTRIRRSATLASSQSASTFSSARMCATCSNSRLAHSRVRCVAFRFRDFALERKALRRESSGLLSEAVGVDLVGVVEIEQLALFGSREPRPQTWCWDRCVSSLEDSQRAELEQRLEGQYRSRGPVDRARRHDADRWRSARIESSPGRDGDSDTSLGCDRCSAHRRRVRRARNELDRIGDPCCDVVRSYGHGARHRRASASTRAECCPGNQSSPSRTSPR